ncbi:MAG: fused MFS/spermidine synthase [Opitutaceae bacterium]|jgi:hypothetical protein
MPLYALTIFIGAFLLFQVQPLMGKYILPWFGGSPGVWTTCLLFFQTALLAGYAYAHYTSKRLKPGTQAILHIVLLLAALACLPIIPSVSWKPQAPGDPTLRILALLTVNLGLPYFVLSATGPLIQRWFSLTHPGVSPYRLFALSNAGSLLALLSYPFFFEWEYTRRTQANLWAGGLVFFVIVCGICAARVRRRTAGTIPAQEVLPAAVPGGGEGTSAEVPSVPASGDRLLWLALPTVASILLLATTNKLCEDLAVVPFLWVLPLSLYLLSFIVCFDSPRWYVRPLFSGLLVVGLGVVTELLYLGGDAPIRTQVIGYSVALFAGCMFCHGELYRRKPHPSRLTSFYLTIAAGGALGGLLVAVVAPLVFNSYLELPIGYWMLSALLAVLAIQKRERSLAFGALAGSVLGLLAALAMRGDQAAASSGARLDAILMVCRDFFRDHWKVSALCAVGALQGFVDLRRVILREWRPRMGSFLIFVSLVLGFVLFTQARTSREAAVNMSRNFFGVLTVYEYEKDNPSGHYYVLQHGRIIHGLQFTDPEKARWPTTYYAETSGVGLVLRSLSQTVGVRIGLVGLGTGTVAAYGEKGAAIRIYEINPQVLRLATSRFNYITQTPAKVDVVMGDARLSMERELERGESQQFDLLVLDAFNSDAIPVHLLTREAFATYLKHMRPDGIIAIDISNRYLDLQPVVESLAKNFGLQAVTISDDDEPNWWDYDTTWMLVATRDRFDQTRALLDAADQPARRPKPPPPLWTDDYTSLFKILR